MDFRSFYSSVSQAWGQLWPSLTYLIVASFALRYCLPSSFNKLQTWVYSGVQRLGDKNPVRGYLTSVGAKGVYPVLLVILALLTLDVVFGVVADAAQWLPPNIVCDDYRIAYLEFSPSDIFRLERLFPDAEDFATAYGRGQFLPRGEEIPLGGLALYTTIAMLVAKATVITIILALCFRLRGERDRKKSVRRSIGVIISAVCVWLVCMAPWLTEYEAGARLAADRLLVKIRDRSQQEDWLYHFQPEPGLPSKLLLQDPQTRWWRLECTAKYRLQALWSICFPPSQTKTPTLQSPPTTVGSPTP
jgi:hypothetical protein